MFEKFEYRKLDIEGTRVAFWIGGAGPPVLMLHGFPQNMSMWGYIAPVVAKAGCTVVCADLRGYGDSDKPRCLPDCSNYSFRALANDQVGLMRRLGHEQFHVIGHGGRRISVGDNTVDRIPIVRAISPDRSNWA